VVGVSRPLRIEFAGALYHVTARGNAKGRIARDEDDFRTLLTTLAQAVERHGWLCHAYCLVGNHFHLLVETPEPNLSRGMAYLKASTRSASTGATGESATSSRVVSTPCSSSGRRT